MATIQDEGQLASSLRQQLTPERCEQLDLDGYLVLDASPLPAAMAEQLLAETRQCFETIPGAARPNAVEFLTSDGVVQLTKPHIYECDLHQQAIRQQLPLFDSFFDRQLGELVELLRERVDCCADLMPFEDAAGASRAVTLKLQRNEGGAFPWHYDNPGRPNRRRLTMVVYLTPGWDESTGGELQLMPFLGPCLTVAPRFNTVALFKSDAMLHRVLPVAANHTRYCFSVWFDGIQTNSDADQYLKTCHLHEGAIPLLRRSPLQRALARAVYEQEFRRALADCFGEDTAAYRASCREHDAHLKQLLTHDAVRSFVALLITYREE